MNRSLSTHSSLPSLALVSLTIPAGAAVVSNSPTGLPWDSAVDGMFSIDFNGDGTLDFGAPVASGAYDTFIAGGGFFGGYAGFGSIVHHSKSSENARLFAPGESIASSPYMDGVARTARRKSSSKSESSYYDGGPLLPDGTRAYVGVIFGAPGAWHAAWVDLEGNGPGAVIVHGWGWETTPNTPILAGAVGVLDEPSGGGAGGPAAAAAARSNVNAQIGQYRAMQANQAHARRVAERQRLQAARR